MIIAVPKETKNKENRVALVPEDVKKLVKANHEIYIENNAGKKAGFSNEEYQKSGAKIVTTKEIYQQKFIIRVKEPPLETIKENQTILAYLHIDKGQNPELLNTLIKNNVTAYAYEMITINRRRAISLGFEAGIVGMFEGLRTYYKNKDSFKNIKSVWKYNNKEEMYQELRKIDPRKIKCNITIAGYGQVSKGAQEVLAQLSHPPKVLKEEDTERSPKIKILPTLKETDIFVNAVLWFPGQDRVITKKDLKEMKPNSLIVDISCDVNGAIETCQATTWDKPTYKTENITHFCVDNLPSALAHDSSKTLSKSILPFVLKIANGKELESGLMTKNKEKKFKI